MIQRKIASPARSAARTVEASYSLFESDVGRDDRLPA